MRLWDGLTDFQVIEVAGNERFVGFEISLFHSKCGHGSKDCESNSKTSCSNHYLTMK